MSALHPALLAWPFALLVGVPLVIHLINLLRRRRVRWGAMEFLLASQKKNRRRIILRQWMLIVARMAAVGLSLLLLAGLVLSGDWARLFGGGEAHHLIVVDDTLSMSATGPAGAAFDRAKQAAQRLAGQIAQENSPQRITLLPYTVVADQTWNADEDWLAHTVDPQRLSADVEARLRDWRPTQLATAPLAVLDGVERLLAQGRAGEERTVHLVTDFRAADWRAAPAVRQRFEHLAESGVKIHLVNCTLASEPNVAISELKLLPGARAAGVPQMLEVAVTNLGLATVTDVTIETSYRPLANAAPSNGASENNAGPAVSLFPSGDAPWTSLPALDFAAIKPGETKAGRLQVRFPAAGDYALRAALAGPFLADADALAADNERYAVAKIALDVPVLVIDGDPRDDDAFHVTTALRPGGATRTGVNVTVKPATFLRDQPLDGFAAVYLLDVGRLEKSAVDALEDYARRGGGVAFFVGPNAHRTTINDMLFRDGAGLFPTAVEGPTDLPYSLASRGDGSENDTQSTGTASGTHVVDIAFDRRGALARLAGEAYQGFAPHLSRYLAIDAARLAAKDSPATVLARLRNDAPLVVARPFGQGRSVVVLTTAGKLWSDWAGSLTFPILLQELQGYLTAGQAAQFGGATGELLELPLDANRYAADTLVTLRTPYDATSPWSKIERKAEPADGGALAARFAARDRRETGRIGIYEASYADKSGSSQVRREARNAAASEGDLTALDARDVAEQLGGVDFVYHGYAELENQTNRVAGVDSSPYLFWLLFALLAGEQLLAYLASYHPSRDANHHSRQHPNRPEVSR
ncbi:MAG: BatA and WFA domain-containing protein [Pirellulales bacterium]